MGQLWTNRQRRGNFQALRQELVDTQNTVITLSNELRALQGSINRKDQQWTGVIRALCQELTDTQNKVISLSTELRAQECFCNTCKERFTSHTAPASPQMAQAADGSSSSIESAISNGRVVTSPDTGSFVDVSSTTAQPTTSKPGSRSPQPEASNVNITAGYNSSDAFLAYGPPESLGSARRSLNQTHIPSTLPPSTAKSFISSPLPVSPSSKTMVPKIEPSPPGWSVKRDATDSADLNVTFVRSFIHTDWVEAVRFSENGNYLSAAVGDGKWYDKGTVAIYNPKTCREFCALPIPTGYDSQYSSNTRPSITCVGFSPDGRYLSFGDAAGGITVWDIQNNRIRNIFRGHSISVDSIDFSPNGRLVVSASRDKTLRIWNVRDGFARILSDNTRGFWSVRFSPDGRYVAAGDLDGILRVWDARTGRLVKRWTAHKSRIRGVAFMPAGRRLLSGGGDVITYWDVSSFEMVRSGGEPVATEILKYTGHKGIINSIAISPDGQWVASASNDKTVMLWNILNAKRQCTLVGHTDVVLSVDFSPDGTYLAAGSKDGHMSLWKYS